MNEDSAIGRFVISISIGAALAAFGLVLYLGISFAHRFHNALTYLIWAALVLATLMLLIWFGMFLFFDIRTRAVKVQILSQNVKVVDVQAAVKTEVKQHQPQELKNELDAQWVLEQGENLIAVMGSRFTWKEYAESVLGYSDQNTTRYLKEVMLNGGYDVSHRPPRLKTKQATHQPNINGNLTGLFEKRYAHTQ